MVYLRYYLWQQSINLIHVDPSLFCFSERTKRASKKKKQLDESSEEGSEGDDDYVDEEGIDADAGEVEEQGDSGHGRKRKRQNLNVYLPPNSCIGKENV